VYYSAYFADRGRRIYLLQPFKIGIEAHPVGTMDFFIGDEAAAV
jgi:hypothetical protein